MSKSYGGAGVSLRRGEVIGGFLFWPFYLVLTGLLVSTVLGLCGVTLGLYRFNLVVWILNFLAAVLIFHRFLLDSLRTAGRSFWLFLQTAVLAVVFYFAVSWVLQSVYSLLKLTTQNGNNDNVMDMVRAHFPVMAVSICVLVPVVEECLCRALLFGTIRKKSRFLAYAVSMLVFAALHVWQYALSYSLLNIVLVTISYLPAGLALGWAYEKSGTIWTSILAHACINLITIYLTLYIF
jgi:membrane protease YdiL (CAAX protease family)